MKGHIQFSATAMTVSAASALCFFSVAKFVSIQGADLQLAYGDAYEVNIYGLVCARSAVRKIFQIGQKQFSRLFCTYKAGSWKHQANFGRVL